MIGHATERKSKQQDSGLNQGWVESTKERHDKINESLHTSIDS